jgi:hypothetical protein
MSNKAKCRPFMLLDAMILVAATAGGFGLWRWLFIDALNSPHNSIFQYSILYRTAAFFVTAGPVILVETLGFIAIRLRQPRPPLRRLMAQPGMMSCVASVCFLTFLATFLIIASEKAGWPLGGLAEELPAPVGRVVATSWMILLLSRRWRFERGWIDMLGVILGCYWIVSASSFSISCFLDRSPIRAPAFAQPANFPDVADSCGR